MAERVLEALKPVWWRSSAASPLPFLSQTNTPRGCTFSMIAPIHPKKVWFPSQETSLGAKGQKVKGRGEVKVVDEDSVHKRSDQGAMPSHQAQSQKRGRHSRVVQALPGS